MTCGMLGDMFQITKIESNGDVFINAVTYKGNLSPTSTKVACKSIIDDYLLKDLKQLPTNADYTHKHATISCAWQVTECSAKITLGLGLIANNVGLANVLIRETPTKQVFACQPFDKGECVLVPAGAKVNAKETSTSGVLGHWEMSMKCEGDLCKTHSFHIGNAIGDVIVPALFVKSTSEEKDANMKFSMLAATISQSSAGSKPVQSKLSLPVLVNRRAIKEGDELIYFKPKRSPGCLSDHSTSSRYSTVAPMYMRSGT